MGKQRHREVTRCDSDRVGLEQGLRPCHGAGSAAEGFKLDTRECILESQAGVQSPEEA